MEKDDVYTVIVKKFSLGKDVYGSDIYIYRPLEFQNGFISENIFYNDNGREYKSLEEISTISKEFDEGFYFAKTEEELKNELDVEGDSEIYKFYQNIVDNYSILCSVDMQGLLTITSSTITDIMDKACYTMDYDDGKVIVPVEDLNEVLKTGNIRAISDYVKTLYEFKGSIQRMEEEIRREQEEINQPDEMTEEAENLNDNKDLTEEEKRKKAEELLKEQKIKEMAEAFEREEQATTITKEQIKELYKDLMSKVIGQEEAIETACYVLYKNSKLKDGESKTNCIFVGPTGSGKSMIADTIGEFFKNKPLVHVDANSLSTTGYVGNNVEDCLTQLMMKADGNKLIAEHGIVVFDEVDKKGTKDNGDVGGKGVINQLLRFVEGQEYKVEYMVNNKKRTTVFDTTNLTIFACGAFPEVYDELIKKDVGGKVAGFTVTPRSNEEIEREKKEKYNTIEISHEDLATKGRMGPEFTGRFIIAPLHKLTVETLKDIMLNSKASALTREIQLLEEDNIIFNHDDSFIDTIAQNAYEEGTGGRGVKNSVEKVFKKVIKKTILTLDDDYVDEETGKIYLYGTTDEEGNLQVKAIDGTNLLEDQVKEKPKVLKL